MKRVRAALAGIVIMLSLFVCSACGGWEALTNRSLFDESNENLYVSTFDLDSSNSYVGRGSLNKFCAENQEFTSVTDIPFETLDANGDHTKFIGTVNELQQQGFYGIVEYDLVTGQSTDILSYEELIEECGRAEETQDEIEQVRYRNSGNACSFIYGKKLWTVKDKRTKLLADLTGMYWGHYEWLSDNEILVETDGNMMVYNIDSEKYEKLFSGCSKNGSFALSDDRKTLVYEGSNRHGLYKFSFETEEKEYLTSLRGSAHITFSADGKRIAYSDGYFTITHSGAQKMYVMNIENKVKKMITKELAWGIAWGI